MRWKSDRCGRVDTQGAHRHGDAPIASVMASNPSITVRELPGLNHLGQAAHTGSSAEYAQVEETMSPEAFEIGVRWLLERVEEGRIGDRVP